MATANIRGASHQPPFQQDAIPSVSQTKTGVSQGAPVKPVKGYSINIFSKDANANKFLCVYCKNVLRIPLQSDCGHRFCQGCKEEMER